MAVLDRFHYTNIGLVNLLTVLFSSCVCVCVCVSDGISPGVAEMSGSLNDELGRGRRLPVEVGQEEGTAVAYSPSVARKGLCVCVCVCVLCVYLTMTVFDHIFRTKYLHTYLYPSSLGNKTVKTINLDLLLASGEQCRSDSEVKGEQMEPEDICGMSEADSRNVSYYSAHTHTHSQYTIFC